MPWQISDVNRFKSGLTDRQKRQWVRIANSALASCKARGGSNCEASAIRQASGVAGNISDMEKFIQINTDYTIRTEEQQGRNHIIVPVVMMVEGVHNGSHGSLLHLTEDLGKFPEAWNGMPVTIQHPQQDGHNVSANSPEVIASQSVGRIYNTHMDNGKLKAEVWLDEARLQELSAEALDHIRQGRELEVSIGVFTDEEQVQGEFRGIPYEAIARNHRPDHLALLPGAEGACSWDDGCGIRNNNKKGGKSKLMKNEQLIEMTKTLNKEGYSVLSLVSDNEQGLRELMSDIQGKLDGMDDNVKVHYLTEVYDDHFVYEIRQRDEGGSTLYKRTYQVNTDESVEFTGEPVEVRRKVEYVAMESSGSTKFIRTKFNSNNQKKKEVKTMSELKKAPCPDRVDELINNVLSKYTKEDKEWLLTQEADVIEKMFPNEPKKEKALQANVEKINQESEKKKDPQTLDEYLEGVPEGIRDSMRAGLQLNKEQREKMIKEILTQTEKGIWDEDDLKVMETDTLKKVFNSVKKEEVDFSVLGNHSKIQDNEEELEKLLPMGVKEEVKTENK